MTGHLSCSDNLVPNARRLSKDHERLRATSEAMTYGAMSRLMLPRLTRVDA